MLSKEATNKIFEAHNITLTDEQYDRLDTYAQMLVERNKVMNLTAITDDEGVTVKHFFDSIYPFTMFELEKNSTLIDVGTGAGFPSCPLKIYRDDISITLLDSLNKRVNFLKELSDKTGLGAVCIHARAEELGRKEEHREKFDAATARAVANLADLCEYCLPFVRVGGVFAALKGSNGDEELREAEKAVKILGGQTERVISYNLPGGDGRTLIVIRKIKPTPEKFPRNSGKIKAKSLRLDGGR